MGNKILLVIEDTFLCSATLRYLGAKSFGGFTVVGTNTRHAALETVKRDRTAFDLVVTETIDPDSFGVFVQAIRTNSPPGTKIVMFADCGCTRHLEPLVDETVCKMDENSIRTLAETVRRQLAA